MLITRAQRTVSPFRRCLVSVVPMVLLIAGCQPLKQPPEPTFTVADVSRCANLPLAPHLTIYFSTFTDETPVAPAHCYLKGLIDGSITFHMTMPARQSWQGRLLHLGDGGADGDLDLGHRYLEDGYAVINSNTGHDLGASGAAYGFRDDKAAENFAHRAVHLAARTAKAVVQYYYLRLPSYTYHAGCSTGGRQGLVAAQFYPYDFDGIVAGAPSHRQFQRMAHRLDLMQHLVRDNYAANLAFDTDGDGGAESLTKLNMLKDTVQQHCDNQDGIADGIVDPACPFDVDDALAPYLCPGDQDGDSCFTKAQIAGVKHLYEGSRTSDGTLAYPGAPLGSESQWANILIPHAGNNFTPYVLKSAAAVIAYTFYANDPGLMPPNLTHIDHTLDTSTAIPEWGWWNFDIDDLNSDKLSSITPFMQATHADLQRFFHVNRGKLIVYHGWVDAVVPPEPTLDYVMDVTRQTFGGDADAAKKHPRTFMAPGVGHCSGGPGPDTADYVGALANWVEHGIAPDMIESVKRDADGGLIESRPLCPYPQKARYAGTGDANLATNRRTGNFVCE